MTNKTYDTLKQVAMLWLPVLVFVLALFLEILPLWEIPNSDKIIATLVAINVALGGLLKRSTVKYKARHSAEEK